MASEPLLDNPELCAHEYIGVDMKMHSAAVKWADGKLHCKFCGALMEDKEENKE